MPKKKVSTKPKVQNILKTCFIVYTHLKFFSTQLHFKKRLLNPVHYEQNNAYSSSTHYPGLDFGYWIMGTHFHNHTLEEP